MFRPPVHPEARAQPCACFAAADAARGVDDSDGVFFQFCMCCGILLTGLVVNTAQGTPPLQPLAMLGGALWCLGNVWVVPIVKAIGMGLGLLIWGSANMLAGWSSGKWGYLFLGLKQQKVENPALNYAGVAVALVGLVIYSFVTPTESKASQRRDDASERNASMSGSSAGSRRRGSETAPLVTVADGGGAHSYGHDLEARSSAPAEAADEEMFVDRMTPAGKKTFGVAASVVSGIFYGVNFDPPQCVGAACPGLRPSLTPEAQVPHEPRPLPRCSGLRVQPLSWSLLHQPAHIGRVQRGEAQPAGAVPRNHPARHAVRRHVGRGADVLVQGQRGARVRRRLPS